MLRFPRRNRSFQLRYFCTALLHGHFFFFFWSHYEIQPVLLMGSFTEEESAWIDPPTVIKKTFPRKLLSSHIFCWPEDLFDEWVGKNSSQWVAGWTNASCHQWWICVLIFMGLWCSSLRSGREEAGSGLWDSLLFFTLLWIFRGKFHFKTYTDGRAEGLLASFSCTLPEKKSAVLKKKEERHNSRRTLALMGMEVTHVYERIE